MNLRKIIREEIGDIFTDIHGKKTSNIDYTAVVIEGDEVNKFESKLFDKLNELGILIPEDWTKSDNYHMTITTGELGIGLKLKGAIGSLVDLKIHSIGVSDESIAVGVDGLFSRNKFQHITIAFKTTPEASNRISKWVEFEPFNVIGYVREIERKDGFGKIKTIEL